MKTAYPLPDCPTDTCNTTLAHDLHPPTYLLPTHPSTGKLLWPFWVTVAPSLLPLLGHDTKLVLRGATWWRQSQPIWLLSQGRGWREDVDLSRGCLTRITYPKDALLLAPSLLLLLRRRRNHIIQQTPQCTEVRTRLVVQPPPHRRPHPTHHRHHPLSPPKSAHPHPSPEFDRPTCPQPVTTSKFYAAWPRACCD